MNNRDQLISSLVGDLTVKKNRLPVIWVAVVWWFLSWVYVMVASELMEPVRAFHHHAGLLHAHQFQIESIIGFIATLLIAIAAWYASIPAALSQRFLFIVFAFITVWLGFYAYGFFDPALVPSMFGKRAMCYVEAFVYSLPTTIIACIYMLRRYPINKVKTGFLIGLAAGMIPALFMQFSCMYEPTHIFIYHIIPAFISGIIGIFILVIMTKIKPTAG